MVPVNATASGASPLSGVAEEDALRAGETTTVTVEDETAATASLTVRVAV